MVWSIRYGVNPLFRYDDLFSFGTTIKLDDGKTVGVNIEFTSVCEYELEEYDFKLNHCFPKKEREDFVKAIIEKYPMKEFKTLEPTDLINDYARELKSLYGSNTVHTYQTDLANDMYFGDTFLFISGFLKIQREMRFVLLTILINHF